MISHRTVAKYLSEDEGTCVIEQEERHADCIKREAGTTKSDEFRSVGRVNILPDGGIGSASVTGLSLIPGRDA